jgi:hypothetical protein
MPSSTTMKARFISQAQQLLAKCEAPPTRCYASDSWFDADVNELQPYRLHPGGPWVITALGRDWEMKPSLPEGALAVA